MIEIHQFPPAFGLKSSSPFSLKIEAYCKLNNINYTCRQRVDCHKMPKGKLPVAIIDGEMIPDSSFIINTLDQTAATDQHLDKKQHAQGYLLQQLCEEQLY